MAEDTMKYYVIEVAQGDKRITGRTIDEYDTKNEAVAEYHRKLAVAMSDPLYQSDLLMVITEQGDVIKRERYIADSTTY